MIERQRVKLEGKRAVVTGGSRGLGKAVASAIVREGATVLICARNAGELEQARAELDKSSARRVHAYICDVATKSDLDNLAAEALRHMGGVDILVANAGVQGPPGPVEDVDWQQWVETIGINLIGAACCCRAFLPLLKAASNGKILILSGGGATKPQPFFSAYAAAKAGVVRFGETLAEEVKPFGIDVNMIAPGALNTRMLDEVLDAGPGKTGEARYRAAVEQRASGGASIDRAAALCVHLVSDACTGVTGRLIRAQWDPWERLEELKGELDKSDIYTLRRIVPSDRGKDWDSN
jgi:3-oxoacyl-[acyl-carrier protein] reductase